ncbi:transposase [Lentibacillus jeotgali]|uniref:transposase n=1 Tax=Lentibacillus jeotgali TaxID=558169 RepID=UPI000A054C98
MVLGSLIIKRLPGLSDLKLENRLRRIRILSIPSGFHLFRRTPFHVSTMMHFCNRLAGLPGSRSSYNRKRFLYLQFATFVLTC